MAMMKAAGARAIATGRKWIADCGVMLRVLRYASALDLDGRGPCRRMADLQATPWPRTVRRQRAWASPARLLRRSHRHRPRHRPRPRRRSAPPFPPGFHESGVRSRSRRQGRRTAPSPAATSPAYLFLQRCRDERFPHVRPALPSVAERRRPACDDCGRWRTGPWMCSARATIRADPKTSASLRGCRARHGRRGAPAAARAQSGARRTYHRKTG